MHPHPTPQQAISEVFNLYNQLTIHGTDITPDTAPRSYELLIRVIRMMTEAFDPSHLGPDPVQNMLGGEWQAMSGVVFDCGCGQGPRRVRFIPQRQLCVECTMRLVAPSGVRYRVLRLGHLVAIRRTVDSYRDVLDIVRVPTGRETEAQPLIQISKNTAASAISVTTYNSGTSTTLGQIGDRFTATRRQEKTGPATPISAQYATPDIALAFNALADPI